MRPLVCCLLSCVLLSQIFAADELIDKNSTSLNWCHLQSPLTSYHHAAQRLESEMNAIQAQLDIPDDAPTDLGVGAFIKDDDGNWFQLTQRIALTPGHHHIHFDISLDSAWQAEPQVDAWNSYKKFLGCEYGLFFWSQHSSNIRIHIEHLRALKSPVHKSDTQKTDTVKTTEQYLISNLRWGNINKQGDACQLRTGERWTMQCQALPLGNNPYNSNAFQLNLLLDGPQGTQHIAGFYKQPMRIIDGGDRDRSIANGPGHFEIRFRPQLSGTYNARLEAIWDQGQDNEIKKIIPMPQLQVSGEHWDDFIRLDENDYRYFCVGPEKKFHWPLGINIRSVTDPRGTQRTHSQITPERIVHAYQAYFERLSRAGGNSVEIWMASWNVGLEWYDQWPGFHGIGMYHEGNAERLDQILDAAFANGIRVILVINNHGQASFKADREWLYSPFNVKNGGPLEEAKGIFTDPRSLAAQEQRRRYIAARYADHPAILCWKMWSEMNLTDIARNGTDGHETLKKWHQHAFTQWKEFDIYDHLVTSHWSGDYRTPYRPLVALEVMDFTAIDAYHGRRNGNGRLLANIMYDSTLHAELGLSAFKKPLVVTEFGCSSGAGPEPQLQAEHGSGPWAALVSGHASSPHLWWYEWTDQGDNWQPYRALSRYLQGEDLRHPQAKCVSPRVSHPQDKVIWCRAWFKPGMIYGYLLDWDWGYEGELMELQQQLQVHIGDQVKAGTMQVQWWDASLGTIVAKQILHHQGGQLNIDVPDFRRHIAYKLKRISSQ
ncbi:MAG: hypothetical protein HRU15_15605 [Planctomycetes bacterium]|nr:hypothetical protein [Planctomycetota bacterium]